MTSPIEVRGMIVAGRRVYWATCERGSGPTKAMMASAGPNTNGLSGGGWERDEGGTTRGGQGEAEAGRAGEGGQRGEGGAEQAQAAGQQAEAGATRAADSARRANDAVARLEAAFSSSVTK